MPELNEDVMEAEGETSEEQPAAGIDEEPEENAYLDEAQEMENEQLQHSEEPASTIEQEEDTLDSADIPKDDEEPQPEALQEVEGQEPASDEGQDLDDPPEAKKIRLSDEASAAEEEESTENADAEEAPLPDPVKEKEPQDGKPDTDMLSTLASAALKEGGDKDDKPAVVPDSVIAPKDEPASKKKEQWHNVGVFDTNTTTVTDYVNIAEPNDDIKDMTSITLAGRRILLEPGTAYKLRVCAINACGPGPWSEVAAFKTTLPGFPGAPSAIKISKSADGAHLTWEPPGGNSGEILEYAVYLAVRSASQGSQPVPTNQSQLAFVRVFCGPTNKCVVGPNSLQAAHIDTTTKPAIIFRIAARNSKGYGPATQVRWLQESTNATPGSPVGKRSTKV